MTLLTPTDSRYYIKPRAVSFAENDLGDVNRVYVSIASGTTIMVYVPEDDLIPYDEDKEYQKWVLTGYPTKLATSDAYYVYARLSRSDNRAIILFSTKKYKVDGSIEGAEGENNPSDQYFYVPIGSLTSSEDKEGKTVSRVLTFDSGKLSTPDNSYTKEETDSTFMSFEVADNRYLNALDNDTAQGIITFEKGLRLPFTPAEEEIENPEGGSLETQADGVEEGTDEKEDTEKIQNFKLINAVVSSDNVAQSELFTDNALLTAAAFNKLFTFMGAGTEEDPFWIRANYTLASVGSLSVLGLGNDGGQGGAGISYSRLDTWEGYDPATMAGYVLSAALGHDLLTRIENLPSDPSDPFDPTGYATKTWVLNEALPPLKEDIETAQQALNDFLTGSDTDDIINKWKELEAFLAGQTETSTLASLLEVKADKTELAKYALLETLADYATQAWVGEQGYIKSSDLDGYATIASVSNAIAVTDNLTDSNTGLTEGYIKSLKADSLSVSGTIAVGNLPVATQQHVADNYYNKTEISGIQTEINGGIAANKTAIEYLSEVFNKLFTFMGAGTEEDPFWIRANYTLASVGSLSVLGLGNDSGQGGAGISYSRLDTWEGYDPATMAGYVLSAALGHDLLTRIENLPSDPSDPFDPTGYATQAWVLNEALPPLKEDIETAQQALSQKADKTELANYALLETLADYVTEQWVEQQGYEANVQSDWNVADTTSDAYIKNKPSIPTLASLMGSAAIGGTTSFIYWNGSAWESQSLDSYATTASVSKAISVTDSLTNTNTGLTDGYINSFTADTLKVNGDFSGNGWSVEGSIAYFGELNATSVSVDGELEAASLSAPSITIGSLPVATEQHVADNYYDKDEITAIQAAINTEITANKDAISSLSTLLNKWFYERTGVLYTSYPFASEKTVSVLGAGSGTGGSTGGSVSLDEVNSDILPVATDWYSIGSATLRWKELHAADINVSSINGVSLTGDSIATTSQLTSLRQGASATTISGVSGTDNYTLYLLNGITNSSTYAQIPSYYGRKFTDIESTSGPFLADEYMVNDILDYVDDAVGKVDVSASLENYYTKTQIDGKGFLTASSLSGYVTQEWVEQQGYEANVQSDWNVADTTSDAYIKNKPAIPTLASLMGSAAIGSTTSFIWWNGSAWKTQSLSTYATLDDVTAVYDYIDGIDFSSYLTDYATKEWVGYNYYTATQIDNKLIPFVTLEGGTATWARHHIFQDSTIYPITVNGIGDRTGINFTKDSVLWGKLGFSAVNTPAFFTTEGSAEPLATQSWVTKKGYLTGGKNASDFGNGYLVRTTIKTASNTMLNFSIIGNSYNNRVSYTRKSFQIHGQFYCYTISDNILQIGAVSLGDELGDIKVFCYDDGSGDTATNKVVCLWFQQTASFQSFSVSVFKTASGTYPSNVVASITNVAMPTSGVTRLKTITPHQVFFNSGGLIDGNLTVKGSLTAEADIFGNGWSVEGGIANFGELNATDIYADSVTVGDSPLATQSWVERKDYLLSSSFNKANIKSTLGISDWALAASKPSYAWNEITSKPTFATVATSGSYNDLSDTPTIPTVVNNLTTSNAKNALSAAQGVELKKLTDANAADILTIAEALQDYATTDQLPTLNSLMGSSAIGSITSFIWWNGSAWKTQSLSTYATLDDVTAVYDYIDGLDFSSYLTDYATKEWVEDNYYTAIQIDNKLIPFVTLEGGTAVWARHHIFQDSTVYPITVNGIGDRTGINFTKGGTLWGKLGFSAVNTPAFFTTEGSAETLATQSWVEGKEYITSSALAEYAKSSILPHTVASYTNGCLVKTDVSADTNSMIYFRIEGNSYGGGYEILTCGQFYNYQSGNSILQYKATHYGYDFGDIKVFNYDGFVCLWFKQQSSFQTFNVCVWRSSASSTTAYNALNRVTSISNITMPTSGVTRLQTITPQITPHIVGGKMVVPSINGGESSLTFQTGTLTDGSYDYKIGKFTDKNNISGFGMGIADSSGKWSKFLGLTTDGQYKVTSVNINNNLAIIGSLTAESDIFGNGWSVEGGIANFGELNATDIYADSVTVGDTSVESKSYTIPAVSAKRWVRIAEMTSYISCGTITISKDYNSINSIPTQHAVFHVQSGYVQSDGIKAEYNITQLACTCNTDSDQYFTRVRIVYANPTTSTSKAYVEVFCNFYTAETLKVSLLGCTNMSLLSAYALGSVPTGYDYRSIYLQPGGARNECYQMIDLSASTYNRDYFYPVVGSKLSASGGFTRIEVRNNLNSELENNVPSWSTHTRGFTANMVVYARGSEWGVNVGQTFCVDYNYSHTAKNPVGYSQMANASLPVLWLRGGGKYNVYTDRLMRWNVKTSTFTSSSESVTPQSGGTAPFRFTKANLYANMVGYINSSNANTFTAKQSFTAEIEVSKTDMVAPITIQGANNKSFVKFTSGTTNLGFLGFNGVNTPAWMPNDATEYIPLASQSWVNTKAEQVGVTANGTYITFGDEDTSIFASGTIVMRGEVQLGSTYRYGFTETGDGNLLSLTAQTVTQTSDLTRKNILSYDPQFSVRDIANAPIAYFTWREGRDTTSQHLGSIAQYWSLLAPECVHGTEGNDMSMEYATLGLVTSIINAREIVRIADQATATDSRLNAALQRIADLEAEVADLHSRLGDLPPG